MNRLAALQAAEVAGTRLLERTEADLVDRGVVARQLERAGEAEPVGVRRRDHARIVHVDRQTGVAVGGAEFDVVALRTFERNREPEPAAEAAAPDAGRQHYR